MSRLSRGLGLLLGRDDSRPPEKFNPMETLGAPGFAVYGGYLDENEKDSTLRGRQKYRVYSEMIANCSIVSASLRYFLNLCGKPSWTFTPADETDEAKQIAEICESMFLDDPETPWRRIVRRTAAMQFYGFSIQEMTLRKRNDGVLTFADIAPRPQRTIERWDTYSDGRVRAVVQRDPQDQHEIILGREKLIYAVDDSLNDSPEGLGLLRHLVRPARQLSLYETLESTGFKTDLRGIPVATAPYSELSRELANNRITADLYNKLLNAYTTFAKNHFRRDDTGLVIDSETYRDVQGNPTSVRKYGVDLLRGGSGSQPDIANAIMRINREMARIVGTESIVLGDGSGGSRALGDSKVSQLSLIVDAAMSTVAETYMRDALQFVGAANGWDSKLLPEMKAESVKYQDIEQVTQALVDLTQAALSPDDPAINEVRSLVGISPIDMTALEEDAVI